MQGLRTDDASNADADDILFRCCCCCCCCFCIYRRYRKLVRSAIKQLRDSLALCSTWDNWVIRDDKTPVDLITARWRSDHCATGWVHYTVVSHMITSDKSVNLNHICRRTWRQSLMSRVYKNIYQSQISPMQWEVQVSISFVKTQKLLQWNNAKQFCQWFGYCIQHARVLHMFKKCVRQSAAVAEQSQNRLSCRKPVANHS